jgi:peptide chain release factor 2
LRGLFDPEKLQERLSELQQLIDDPNLWDNQEKAQSLLKEQTKNRNLLDNFNQFNKWFIDTKELAELGDIEEDNEIILATEKELVQIATKARKLRIECLFTGEVDGNDCFLEINAGAGGTESHDWALMLMRMYLRWAEQNKFKTEIIDELDGEEAGIKSATIKISGINAYGWCKSESGVHRLVRLSPFNAAGKRQTSFASVWVYPVIDDNIKIEINEKDLRVDTYRASGAGGQHVNKTDSAVRITHLPTNIAVACQSDRSQHKNRAEAMSMLKSRLYEIEMQKKQSAIDAQNASKTDNGWGHQIRSYVLHPYQMVKDLRTDYETSDSNAVLNGEISNFMSAYLEAHAIGKLKAGE